MVRVAVDVMGGDHAPVEIIKGAVAAIRQRRELKLFLVGKEDIIKKIMERENYSSERIEITAAADLIAADDEPGIAVRRKKDASMVVAIELVKSGRADAVLSAGNTGALMVGSLLLLGRLEGIERPALLAVFPTFKNRGVVVLDIGANMDAKPEHLWQYACIGTVYAEEVLGYLNPKCGLLNIGVEKNKGNNQTRKAFSILETNIDYFEGNIEASDVFSGDYDVIISDGFVGNILLKTAEGISKGLFAALRKEFSSNIYSKIGAALLLPGMRRIKNAFDDTEYGGAPLIGVNGICIKCHGSSKAKTIKQAILKQAYPMVKNQTNAKITQALFSVWQKMA